MPPKKESAAERSVRLTREADEIKFRATYLQACASMKANPAAVTAVKHHLRSLGLWVSSSAKEVTACAASCSSGSEDEVASQGRKRAGCVPAFLDSKADEAVACMKVVSVHRNFATWSQVPPRHLERILSAVEPISLNVRMLKVLCSPGQRVVPRDKLLHLLEFATNIDPSSQIGDERDLDSLIAFACERSVTLNRRAQQLRLPVDWSSTGVWHILTEGGATYLEKFGERVALPPRVLTGHGASSLFVEMNWAECRATLRSKVGPSLHEVCSILFHSSKIDIFLLRIRASWASLSSQLFLGAVTLVAWQRSPARLRRCARARRRARAHGAWLLKARSATRHPRAA